MRKTYILIKIISSIKNSFFLYVFLMIACYIIQLITEKLNVNQTVN